MNVDRDAGAFLELGAEGRVGEFVLEALLDDSLQWAGTVDRVVALFGELFLGSIRDLQREAVVFETLLQTDPLQIDDLPNLVLRQWVKVSYFLALK